MLFCFITDPLDDSIYDFIRNIPHQNVQKAKKAKISMLPKTRTLLNKFYAPYNAELASLLNNTAYLWKDET
jgi:hypothetical protein